jgi:hypothetical protein
MKWKLLIAAIGVAFASFQFCTAQSRNDKEIQDVKAKMIWNKAPYNAFTDIIRFKGRLYCTFREGSGHVPGKTGTDGEIRILVSKTGDNWKSVALLKKSGIDLRDPKFSVTPDGRLMIICGGSVYKGDTLLARYPHVSFSNKGGTKFSMPERVALHGAIHSDFAWIWRVTWHGKIGYGIDYQIGPKERRGPTKLFLVSTKDGKSYSLVHEFHIDGFPNESTVRFDKDGQMYVLIRRELNDKLGMLAVSRPPFTDWTFHKLSIPLGGPNFIFLGDDRLLIGTRTFKETQNGRETHTGLLLTDLEGNIQKTIQLPSGNDTGYPGLLNYNDTLWVTYYSNHENQHTSIFLAKIPIDSLTAQ